MRQRSLYILLFLTQALFAQAGYIKTNEELVFSFKTNNGKKAVLAKDKSDKYLVYRFGTNDKIELEYPGNLKDSWSKFRYSYYLRGGGKMNAGLELQSIIFENGGYKYEIYHDYSAEEQGNGWSAGIRVTNSKTSKTADLIGDTDSIKGSLAEVRESGLMEIEDDHTK